MSSQISLVPKLQQVSDAGGFNNLSTIREGSVQRFGLTGIEQVCSNEKRIQFVDGREFYYGANISVVQCNSLNDDVPDNTYDETQGFVEGSFYNSLGLGKTYICTNATANGAEWLPLGGQYLPTLDHEGGAIKKVELEDAYYSINNGMVDGIIYGIIDIDFSTDAKGTFKFTLPIENLSKVRGSIAIDNPIPINGVIIDDVIIGCRDVSFSETKVPFVATFKYQVY
jgi:hypothetical protein